MRHLKEFMLNRTVFFVSDGTGITAETFGNAILAQFEIKPRHIRLPFVDSEEKLQQAVIQINQTAEKEGVRPIVFTTLAKDELLDILALNAKALIMDMFSTFVKPLELEIQSPYRQVFRYQQKQGLPRSYRSHQFQSGPR